VHDSRVLDPERRLFAELLRRGLGPHPLGAAAGAVVAEAVDRPVAGDPVQPRADRAGVAQPPDSPKRREPDLLEDVEGGVLVGQHLGRVIEQWRLHLADKFSERPSFPRLVPKGEPFVACPACGRVHSDFMSELGHRRFNRAVGKTVKLAGGYKHAALNGFIRSSRDNVHPPIDHLGLIPTRRPTMRLSTLVLAVFLISTARADDPPAKPVTPTDAAKKVNEKVVVEFEVKSSGGNEARFLNSEEDYKDAKNFTIYIPEAAVEKFKKVKIDDPKTYFKGKTIQVTGTVTLYRDKPQIKVENPDQIKVTDKK
jgi:hypothetical protein